MSVQPLMAALACAGLVVLGVSVGGCDAAAGTSTRPSGTGAGTVLTWTKGASPKSRASGVTVELNGITFGGDAGGKGLFVAVGEAGTVITSPDGVTWTAQASQTPLNLFGVTYASGQFIAVGGTDGAAGVLLTGTPDGTRWTAESVSDTLGDPLIGVSHANGTIVAVGYSQVLTSTDGVNWSALSTEPGGITGPTVDLYSTAYGAGLFVTVGTYSTSTSSEEIAYDGLIATSRDGTDWTILPYTPDYLSGVTYGGGQFVAVGREGSILTSTDGQTWASQTASGLDATETPYLISVLYAGGEYVAAGNYVGKSPSTGFLLSSSDARTWSVQPVGANVYAVAYGTVDGVGTYVAVGGE